MAQTVADSMEKAAKGAASLHKALDAVRAAAEVHGMATKMPSIRGYFEAYKPTGSSNHIANCKRALRLFCNYLGAAAAHRLDSLTTGQCRNFIQYQQERVTYGTVKHYKGCISAALNMAVEDELLLRNPMSVIRLTDKGNGARATKRLPFTAQELRVIFLSFPSPLRELALTSFLTGGQRLGDVALLKWKSIDDLRDTIHFRTMKTGKQIIAPIVPELREILENQRIGNKSEYVFPYAASRYIRSKGSLSTEFTAKLRAFGILEETNTPQKGDRRTVAVKSFHSIRHSVVSLMRTDNRFSPDLVRDIVGHDSEAVERGYYTADIQKKAEAIEYISRLV